MSTMPTKDEDHKLPISYAVGYMLKVIKSGKRIDKFKDEFNAIKHGDYDMFLDYIKEPEPFMVQWSRGVIKTDNFSQRAGDCDFVMMLRAEPSISKFLTTCFAEYGSITDADLPDPIFMKCAAFEISLRNHNNNIRASQNIPWEKKDLVDVIDELCVYRNIPEADKNILQDGRKFLNRIKHKPSATSWADGVTKFNVAWTVRNKYLIQLV